MNENMIIEIPELSLKRQDEYLRLWRKHFDKPRAGLKRLAAMALREHIAMIEQANQNPLSEIRQIVKDSMKEAQS